MTFANEITALIAGTLMLLVARGFGPHILPSRRASAGSLMRLAVMLIAIKSLIRMAWWDLARPLLGWAGIMPPLRMPLFAEWLNAGLNSVTAAAALAALAALHRSLPAVDRARYSWLTAPFYPRHLRLALFRRDE